MTMAGAVEPTSKYILYASGPSRDYVDLLSCGCMGLKKAVSARP
jgi:DNA-directed RNA polymerase specialized sigma subunit